MTQEFVTLPIEVVERALASLESEFGKHSKSASDIRAALERPQNHVEQHLGMVPAGWKLVPVEPNCSMVLAGERSLGQHDFLRLDSAYRAMLAAAPHQQVVEQPQQVEMLGETCIDGGKCHHKCTDRCFRRECCAPFSDYSGPWEYEQTQPQGERAQQVAARKCAVFEASIDFIGALTGMKPPPIETAPPEIFEPFRNFTDRVCSIFSGTQPTSKPLTDEHLKAIINTIDRDEQYIQPALRQLARAIEAAHNIK